MWNWIKSLFKKKKASAKEVPIPEQPTMEDAESFPKKKIAIIVGHGPKGKDGGANTWNGSNEFAYNSLVAEYVKSKSKHLVKVFYRGSTGIVGVAMEAVAWRPDCSIELHLNSFNGKARGCEVLCLSGDNESAVLGRSFASEFSQKFNRVLRGDRGIKWLASGDRGAASLKAVSPIKQSILVEPFFADNKEEWIEAGEYARFLTDWMDKL